MFNLLPRMCEKIKSTKEWNRYVYIFLYFGQLELNEGKKAECLHTGSSCPGFDTNSYSSLINVQSDGSECLLFLSCNGRFIYNTQRRIEKDQRGGIPFIKYPWHWGTPNVSKCTCIVPRMFYVSRCRTTRLLLWWRSCAHWCGWVMQMIFDPHRPNPRATNKI